MILLYSLSHHGTSPSNPSSVGFIANHQCLISFCPSRGFWQHYLLLNTSLLLLEDLLSVCHNITHLCFPSTLCLPSWSSFPFVFLELLRSHRNIFSTYISSKYFPAFNSLYFTHIRPTWFIFCIVPSFPFPDHNVEMRRLQYFLVSLYISLKHNLIAKWLFLVF